MAGDGTPIVLYDLVGRDDRRFSPNCWRTRAALAHKRLPYETVPTRFGDIPQLGASAGDDGIRTLPTIRDGAVWMSDSDAIARYLEDSHPEGPSLFGGTGGRMTAEFVRSWTQVTLHAQIARFVLLDIHDHLADDAERAYFRRTRERLYGARLEEIVAGREARIPAFRTSLEPLRVMLRVQSFIGGDTPLYPDYMVLGAFQWARTISPFARELLAADDPLRDYLECLMDLHDGLARQAVGYEI